MSPQKKTYTIKEIAELAGVSKGTVDRVIHQRGKVAEKTERKIKQLLKQVDFKPNLIAQNLKKNKKHLLYALVPNPEKDVFWAPCLDGINQAKKQYSDLQIDIKTVFYDPALPADFLSKGKELLNNSPHGLVFPPIFQKQAQDLTLLCKQKKIKFHLFNNPLLNSKENYVGQNLIKSGRIGAKLLQILVEKNHKIALLHIDENSENALHMTEKELGFKNYFEVSNTKEHLLSVHHLKHKKIESLKKSVNFFLDNNPEIKGVFVTNSKAHIVAQLAASKNRKLAVVGYDLTNDNIQSLKNNSINFLIHQAPQKQIFSL